MSKKQLVCFGAFCLSLFALAGANGQQVDSSINGQVQGAQVSAQADPSVQPGSKPVVLSDQSGGIGRYELRMNTGGAASGTIEMGNASGAAISSETLSSSISALSNSDGNVKAVQGQTYTATQNRSGAGLVAVPAGAGGSALQGGFPDSTRGTAALGSGWSSEVSSFSLSTGISTFDPVFSDHQFNPNINVVSNRAAYHGTSPSEESSWVSWFTNPYEYIYSLYGISEPGSQGLVQASDLQTHLIDWSDMELQYTLHPGVMSEVELQQAGTLHMNSGTGY